MNPAWQDFLTSQPISFTPSSNALYAIPHLSILKVSGDDAAQFLQGQLTCNIKELTEQNSFFSGFCNAKGRVISTLLILKQNDEFLIILPTVLLEKVKNKLKMYVLRSKVQLENASEEFCLSGLSYTNEIALNLSLPETDFSRHNKLLKLPNVHYLLIANAEESVSFWSERIKQGFQVQGSQLWQALDLNAGLAWLDETSSEEYIPQMLNLDKLGGISFTKGCYTGQEVVARTHYLGKAKRELFLAETTDKGLFVNAYILSKTDELNKTEEILGNVLSYVQSGKTCRMLVVLQTSAINAPLLKVDTMKQSQITLIPFATA